MDALADRLASELRAVRKNPARAESVRRARTAARRLLAAGELWASASPGWRRLRERLPRVVRRLGALRNLDVAIALLVEGPREEREARKALARYFRKLRRKEREAVQRWLSEERVDRLARAVDRVVKDLRKRPMREIPGPPDLAPHLARLLTLLPGAGDPKGAHEVRRQVRRLRYAHETLEWAYDPADFSRAIKLLTRIQAAAGQWQDRCVVEELAGRAVRKGRVAVPLTGLLARLQDESQIHAARFVSAASELSGARWFILGEFL